jgi:glycerol-3-phosphate acyltransferase PlsY
VAGAAVVPSLPAVGASLLAGLAVAGLLAAGSRRAELAGLGGFAFLAAALPLELGPGLAGWLAGGLSLAAAGLSLWLCLRGGVFRFPAGREQRWWRVLARPFALLFVPIDRLFGRTALLFLLGALALAFSALDLLRLFSSLQMRRLFKASERKRFSSMTAFLVAIFLVFLVFPDQLPYLGLGFITLGDLFGKAVGIRFGRVALLRGRTLEGSLAFTAGGLAAAWLLRLALRGAVPPVPAATELPAAAQLPLYTVLVGPPVAALVELFSGPLDDNFTVGLISTAFLYSLRYFLRA